MRYRVRSRSDGVVEIRRLSIVDAIFTPDMAILVLLLVGWAMCMSALIEALVVDAALTSFVVMLGTAAVSTAIAVTRLADAPPRPSSPGPPRGRAA